MCWIASSFCSLTAFSCFSVVQWIFKHQVAYFFGTRCNSFLPTVFQRRFTISFIAVQMLCEVMFKYIFHQIHQILAYVKWCKVSILLHTGWIIKTLQIFSLWKDTCSVLWQLNREHCLHYTHLSHQWRHSTRIWEILDEEGTLLKINLSKSDISPERLYHSRSQFSKKLMVSVRVSWTRKK